LGAQHGCARKQNKQRREAEALEVGAEAAPGAELFGSKTVASNALCS
jgi:hypothetical protein